MKKLLYLLALVVSIQTQPILAMELLKKTVKHIAAESAKRQTMSDESSKGPEEKKLNEALILAIRSDKSEEDIIALLEKGANPNALYIKNLGDYFYNYYPSKCHITPLYIAASYKRFDLFDFLLKHGAQIDDRLKEELGQLLITPLDNYKSEETIVNLLKRGADPNAQYKAYETDCYGGLAVSVTPLLAAARCKHVKTSKLLLEYGAKPDALDDHRNSALYYFVAKDSREGCLLILKYLPIPDQLLTASQKKFETEFCSLSEYPNRKDIQKGIASQPELLEEYLPVWIHLMQQDISLPADQRKNVEDLIIKKLMLTKEGMKKYFSPNGYNNSVFLKALFEK